MQEPPVIGHRQFEILMNYMETHRDLAVRRFSNTHRKQEVQQKWEALALKLNNVKIGVTKTTAGWQEYWNKLRYSTRKKHAKRRRHAQATVGDEKQPKPTKRLSAEHRRILALMRKKAMCGNKPMRFPCNEPISSLHPPPLVALTPSASSLAKRRLPASLPAPLPTELPLTAPTQADIDVFRSTVVPPTAFNAIKPNDSNEQTQEPISSQHPPPLVALTPSVSSLAKRRLPAPTPPTRNDVFQSKAVAPERFSSMKLKQNELYTQLLAQSARMAGALAGIVSNLQEVTRFNSHV